MDRLVRLQNPKLRSIEWKEMVKDSTSPKPFQN